MNLWYVPSKLDGKHVGCTENCPCVPSTYAAQGCANAAVAGSQRAAYIPVGCAVRTKCPQSLVAVRTAHPTRWLRREHQEPSGLFCKLHPKSICSAARRAHQYMAGFSYTEVLVATFILAIALVPALEALQNGVRGSVVHAVKANQHYLLTGKLEDVLAQPFTQLEQEADSAGGATVVVDAYSDTAGTEGRRLVYLARYDGDNSDADNDPFTGTDQGLLWVRVQIEGTNDALETLTTQ